MMNLKTAVFAGLLLTFSQPYKSFAISEENYSKEYSEKIQPIINSYQHGFFKGMNNVSIHFATYEPTPQATNCLVILPGRGEPIEKYAEVIYDLEQGPLRGSFQYLLMDHRGQGSSERMIKDKPQDSQKGHVDQFENYTLDLKTFMDETVATKNCKQHFLLAHSLGAGIAVDFLQQYSDYFNKAVFSSPMLKIQTAPYKYSVARSIVLASMAAGRAKMYAIGQKPHSGIRDFENNTFTTSPARYEMSMSMSEKLPDTKLGGVTNRWLNEVMNSTYKIRKKYSEIQIPIKVIHAGIESYSEKSEMIKLCDEALDCERLYLPTSKHEVLMDRDENRDLVVKEISNFIF